MSKKVVIQIQPIFESCNDDFWEYKNYNDEECIKIDNFFNDNWILMSGEI